MNSSTDAIVDLLKKAIAARGENTSSLANLTGLDRRELKRMLGGASPLTVDAMMKLGEALELDANFLKSLGVDTPPIDDSPIEMVDIDPWSVDPYGNHSEQLIKMGFALGLIFVIVLDTEKIEKSGVPKTVLTHYAPRIPIRLDPEYHVHNEPKYDQNGFQLRLSFDAVYTCEFPWDSIIQIIFMPKAELPTTSKDDKQPAKSGSHLRIVK